MWYQIKFRAFHKNAKVPVEFVALVQSEVDGDIKPVTLKSDCLCTIIRDYDLSGLEGIHAVKIEALPRKSYILSMEKIIGTKV